MLGVLETGAKAVAFKARRQRDNSELWVQSNISISHESVWYVWYELFFN